MAAGGDLDYDVGAFLPPPDRAYRVQARLVATPQGDRVVVAAISRSKHDEALRELLLQLAIADLLALGGASFVGYRTARAALDPVEAYRRAAEQAGARSSVGCRWPRTVTTSSPDSATRSTTCSPGSRRAQRGSASSSRTPRTSCAPRWP